MTEADMLAQFIQKLASCEFMSLYTILPDIIREECMAIQNYMEVDYQDVNVLADENIRQGIKDYSDWPTIPQLYVKGEFVGGCDIITEMTMSGELDTMFDENGIKYDKDAADKIRESNA